MELILRGRARYNTETAEAKGTYKGGEGDTAYTEILYRKRSNEYFLYGTGECMSKYASKGGAGWRNGEEVIPLTYEQAEKWAKEHLPESEYNTIFGEIKTNKSSYPCHLILPYSTAKKLRRTAEQMGKKQNEVVTELIEKYL